MTNKPILSVERELLERIAKPLKVLADKPYRTKAILELRAILDAQHVVCSNGIMCQNSKCAECGGNGAYKPVAWARDMDYRPEELGSPETEPSCRTCNDTKTVDDGELTHSSGGIPFECGPIKCVKDCPDCKEFDQKNSEPAAWVNGQQLLLCSKSPRVVEPENPMMHNLPRSIAGSALRTDYCDTPLFADQPAPMAIIAATAFAKGFNTLETIGGKYKIIMQFSGHDDAWAAYSAIADLAKIAGAKA